jgi:hypothetical protein
VLQPHIKWLVRCVNRLTPLGRKGKSSSRRKIKVRRSNQVRIILSWSPLPVGRIHRLHERETMRNELVLEPQSTSPLSGTCAENLELLETLPEHKKTQTSLAASRSETMRSWTSCSETLPSPPGWCSLNIHAVSFPARPRRECLGYQYNLTGVYCIYLVCEWHNICLNTRKEIQSYLQWQAGSYNKKTAKLRMRCCDIETWPLKKNRRSWVSVTGTSFKSLVDNLEEPYILPCSPFFVSVYYWMILTIQTYSWCSSYKPGSGIWAIHIPCYLETM